MKLHTYNYIKQCLEMGHEVRVLRPNSYSTLNKPEDLQDNSFSNIGEYKLEIIPRIPKILQPGERCYIIDTKETREYAK